MLSLIFRNGSFTGARAIAVATAAASLVAVMIFARGAAEGSTAYVALSEGVRIALSDEDASVRAFATTRVFGSRERTFAQEANWSAETRVEDPALGRDALVASTALVRPLLSFGFGLYKSRFVRSTAKDGASRISMSLEDGRIPAVFFVGIPICAAAVASEAGMSANSRNDIFAELKEAGGIEENMYARFLARSLTVEAIMDEKGRVASVGAFALFDMFDGAAKSREKQSGAGASDQEAVVVEFTARLEFDYDS